MSSREYAAQEAEAIIAAHDAAESGLCAGRHSTPKLYPCNTRLVFEHIAVLLGKRRRGATA